MKKLLYILVLCLLLSGIAYALEKIKNFTGVLTNDKNSQL
tara:strand:+ start:384 stop:503 length:120 start_codon:yes stop_codon:yes gene_type:complete